MRLHWPSVSVCLLPCVSSAISLYFSPSFFPLFGSDSGFFFRVLGRHQTCMLDERRDPLEVFSKAVHLPKGLEHQPVLPYHHPASGTWININTNNRRLILNDPHIFSLNFVIHLTDVHSANNGHRRHVRLFSFWSVFISERHGDWCYRYGRLLRGVWSCTAEIGLCAQQLCR